MNNMKPEGICDVRMSMMAKRAPRRVCGYVILPFLSRRQWCFGSVREKKTEERNHGTQDSRVVPHRGTNWAALRLTAQIERDAVLSKSYGRG